MPSNIFATTGTNVSVLFIDATNTSNVVLIDASGLGKKVKEGKNQRTVLSSEDQELIVSTYAAKEEIEDFSKCVRYDEIPERNYSLSASQYFDIKIEHVEITCTEFSNAIQAHQTKLNKLFSESKKAEKSIAKQLGRLDFE